MDNLEAIIHATALAVLNGTGTYSYARKADFSLQHDKPAPFIYFMPPTSRGGTRAIAYNCLFMFVEPDPETGTLAESNAIIARMQTLSEAFFDELDKQPLLELSDYQGEEPVKVFSGHLSGKAFQRTITTPLPLNCEPVTDPA